MPKSSRVMPVIAVILGVIFSVTVFNDYQNFQENLEQIQFLLQGPDPSKLQAAWFAVVLV